MSPFEFDGVVNDFPVVFTETDFLKRLPSPDASVVDEFDEWFSSL